MRRWRMPVISRQGISGWETRVAAETLPAASPRTSSDRMAAFWCNRLARKAASSTPSTKPCASRAASSISRRSAASRSGISAIEGFGLFKDCPTTDEIPAPLDHLPLDEVDRASEKSFQGLLQVGECCKIVPGCRLEGNEEISIASAAIEIGAPRSGAEDLQPRHTVAAARRGKSIALFVNVRLHRFLLAPRNDRSKVRGCPSQHGHTRRALARSWARKCRKTAFSRGS